MLLPDRRQRCTASVSTVTAWQSAHSTMTEIRVWKWICVSIASLARRTAMQLILFPDCSDCRAKKPLWNWQMILVSAMTADRSHLSDRRSENPPRSRSISRKKTIATRCWPITSIFSENGNSSTHRNSRRMNGILCSWKPCKEKAISSICLIRSCMALPKKRKLL